MTNPEHNLGSNSIVIRPSLPQSTFSVTSPEPLHPSYTLHPNIPVYCLLLSPSTNIQIYHLQIRPALIKLQTHNPQTYKPRISPSQPLTQPQPQPCSHQTRPQAQPPKIQLHGSKLPSPQSDLFSNLPLRKMSLRPMPSLDGLEQRGDAVDLLGRLVENRPCDLAGS